MRDRLAAVWRLLRTEHGWSRVWVSLGMAITMAGGGLIYYQTTQDGGDCTYPTCFPDASNTGVPPGTNLTTYTGPMTITVDNTVIDSKIITGVLTVQAEGVIIRKSQVTGGIDSAFLTSDPPLLIQDVEIICNTDMASAAGGSDTTYERLNIHGTCDNGIDMQTNLIIRDNYIHDVVGSGPDPHVDSIQDSWGTNTLIEHNTLLSRDTSSIIMQNYDGHPSVDNWIVRYNLMGAQTSASVANVIYCPSTGGTNRQIINNHFKTQYPPVGGYSDGCDRADVTWSGNVSHETGDTIVVDQPG